MKQRGIWVCPITTGGIGRGTWVPRERRVGGVMDGVSFSNGSRVRLTKAERQILELVALGLKSRDIAERLFVSVKDVDYHVGNMILKFGAPNRTGVVARAFVSGHIAVNQWPPKCTSPEFHENSFTTAVVSTKRRRG